MPIKDKVRKMKSEKSMIKLALMLLRPYLVNCLKSEMHTRQLKAKAKNAINCDSGKTWYIQNVGASGARSLTYCIVEGSEGKGSKPKLTHD
jgi:hypothetical protein